MRATTVTQKRESSAPTHTSSPKGAVQASVRDQLRGMSYAEGAAALAPVQRSEGGPATTPIETPILTNNVVASSTAVDTSQMGPNRGGGGGGGGGGPVTPSTWDRFIQMVEQIEAAIKGDATQSVGWQIYGNASSSKDSTATKYDPKGLPPWLSWMQTNQSFDYAEFMKLWAVIDTAMPAGTKYQDTIHHLQGLDIADTNQVLEFCFHVVSEKDEIEELLLGEHEEHEDEEQDPKKNTEQSGGGGATSVTGNTETTQSAGANTAWVSGTGPVAQSKIVLFYERCKLKKNAPLDALSPEDKQSLEPRKESVWGRAWLADGTKRYEIDGQWRKPIVIPAALKNTGPGDFATGGDGIFFGIGSVNYRASSTKNGREEFAPLTFSTPWADLL